MSIYDQENYWEVGAADIDSDPWRCGIMIRVDKEPDLQGFVSTTPQSGLTSDFRDLGKGVAVRQFTPGEVSGSFMDGCTRVSWSECINIGALELAATGPGVYCQQVNVSYLLVDGSGNAISPDIIGDPNMNFILSPLGAQFSRRLVDMVEDFIADPNEGFVVTDAYCVG
jgi:hypothetical protein